MSQLKRSYLIAAMAFAIFGGYALSPSGLGPASASAQPAQANSVKFPLLEKMIQYTKVERGDVTELMLASPDTIAAIQATKLLPIGTQIVLADHKNGQLHRYLVAQKVGDGRDDWQYQSFLPNKSIQATENPARCFSCHQSRQDQQYMYTLRDALRFK